MRILLTGCGGQLGRHLAPRLARLGEVIATDREGGDFQCDLSDRRLLDKTLHRVKPDVVVNPAAWTAVDRAEDEPELAARMNRAMPGWIADLDEEERNEPGRDVRDDHQLRVGRQLTHVLS